MNLNKQQIGGAVAYFVETEFGSQKAAAQALGVTQPDISRAIDGAIVRPQILDAMGLEQVTMYQTLVVPQKDEEQLDIDLDKEPGSDG